MSPTLRREAALFFSALRFFTRLPVPAWVGHSTELLNHSARYFPLVGWLVAAAGATVLWLAAQVLPAGLAVVLSMAATIRLTGAFHEDGWGDVCDGFGGGWTREQILLIMKDSRIGAYGAIGIVLMLAGKLAALAQLTAADATAGAIALAVAHPLSRLASTTLIRCMDYARDTQPEEIARAKPLAHRMSNGEWLAAAAFGAAPLAALACFDAPHAALALLAVALTSLAAARHFQRRIGGYTGDCLGAVQQLTELATYCALCAHLPNA